MEHEKFEGTVSCHYKPLRPGELEVSKGEEVEIISASKGYALVKNAKGEMGNLPNYIIELTKLPGKTLGEQMEYRRKWIQTIDECKGDLAVGNVLSEVENDEKLKMEEIPPPLRPDERPHFLTELSDLTVREGDEAEWRPIIQSASRYTVEWKGPAVGKGEERVKVETICGNPCLRISNTQPLDAGPYSIIAENQSGVSSSFALLKVIERPAAPTTLSYEQTSRNAIKLSWKSSGKDLLYCIEFRREDMPEFKPAAHGIPTCKVSIRHFSPATYHLRCFAYNDAFRSPPSKEITVRLWDEDRNTVE